MLPQKFRYWLFDTLSVQTMRYVSAVSTAAATGLTKKVYDMIQEDFFKNGSLTSRSKVPELMAAIWTLGRESMLVEDKVDRTMKDAISALLSQFNHCPYCEDMLISLVHAGGKTETAKDIFVKNEFDASETTMRRSLEWVRSLVTPGNNEIPESPFTVDQLPEVIGTLMGMSDINRFSHVVMEDSPVSAPLGFQGLKFLALKLFGSELKATRRSPLLPGRALELLPPAELPEDMQWAKSNPRVADAVSRWADTVEREGARVISPSARQVVTDSLNQWNGEPMPFDSSWIEHEVKFLTGEDKAIARLAIVVGKASYRVTGKMVADVLGKDRDEERFIRILAWSSFSGARRFAQMVHLRIAGKGSINSRAVAA